MANQTQQTLLERMGTGQLEYRIINGESQSAGQLFQGVVDGNTKGLLLQNGNSDIYAIITGIGIRASGKILIDKAFNVTEDTAGDSTDTGVINKRSDADGTGVTVLTAGDNETGSYSGGNSFSTKTAGGGGASPQISPGESVSGLANVVAPSDNMLVEVTNDSGGTEDISIDIDYVELPVDELP